MCAVSLACAALGASWHSQLLHRSVCFFTSQSCRPLALPDWVQIVTDGEDRRGRGHHADVHCARAIRRCCTLSRGLTCCWTRAHWQDWRGASNATQSPTPTTSRAAQVDHARCSGRLGRRRSAGAGGQTLPPHQGDCGAFGCSWPGCGTAFAVQLDLTVHMRRRTVTGERPYGCSQGLA